MAKKDIKEKKYAPQEILAEIEAYREYHRNRFRKRSKVGLQFLAATVAIGFVFWCTMSRTTDRMELDGFNNLCRTVKDGETLEAVRAIASDRQMVFEEDSGSAGLTPDPIYVLRPDTNWPERFGCKFEARAARVYRKN